MISDKFPTNFATPQRVLGGKNKSKVKFLKKAKADIENRKLTSEKALQNRIAKSGIKLSEKDRAKLSECIKKAFIEQAKADIKKGTLTSQKALNKRIAKGKIKISKKDKSELSKCIKKAFIKKAKADIKNGKITSFKSLQQTAKKNGIKLNKREVSDIRKAMRKTPSPKPKEGPLKIIDGIPEGYKILPTGAGNGNKCFYCAIAQAETGDQNNYTKVQDTIISSMNKFIKKLRDAKAKGKGFSDLSDRDQAIIMQAAEDIGYEVELDSLENDISMLEQLKANVKTPGKMGGMDILPFYAIETGRAIIIFDQSGTIQGYDPEIGIIGKDNINKTDIRRATNIHRIPGHFESLVPIK